MLRYRWFRVAVLVSVSLFVSVQGFAQGSRRIAEGLFLPVLATAPAGDARIFVAQQDGLIRIVQNASSGVVPGESLPESRGGGRLLRR
jgi:hypothetical protein